MYADDTPNYLYFYPNQINTAITKVQECFSELQTWMNNNKLVLNASKTEIIVFGSQHLLNKINLSSITLGGVEVTISDKILNLGVTFDPLLSFEQHSRQLSSSCFYQFTSAVEYSSLSL